MSMNKIEINDLRSAIEYLKNVKGQLVKSDVEVTMSRSCTLCN